MCRDAGVERGMKQEGKKRGFRQDGKSVPGT